MSAGKSHLPERTPSSHWRTGFWSLIATQFQGAFSENALKNLVIFLVFGLGLSETQKNELVPIVMIVFAMPFIIFSMVGGYLADRFSKRSVTIGTKIFEISSALCALAGLALKNLPLEFAAIFLLDTQGAVFGPSKYGLLPEILPEQKLSWGNGIIELGTFLAIISGTIASGFLSDVFRGRQQWSGVILIALAVFGTLTSLGISRVPVANPERKFHSNFVTEVWREVREARKDHVLWLALWGSTYFWFLAALLQPVIILYGKDVLHLSDTHNGFLQGALAIGIGVGSYAAGHLSGGKIEYGLIPLGALGLTVFSVALAASHLTFTSVLVLLAFLGFFGGFFVVPIQSLIEYRPESDRRGAMLATAGVLSFIGIGPIAATAYYLLTVTLHLSAPSVFVIGSGLTFVTTIGAVVLLPDSLLRFILWLATHSLYRIRIEGRANIPERGGALFVANRMSFIDALLLTASTDRHIRFLMDRDLYEHPAVHPFARVLRAIPVSPSQRPDEFRKYARDAANAISSGEVVCISDGGEMASARESCGGEWSMISDLRQQILEAINAPIVAVNVSSASENLLRIDGRRTSWKFPRRLLAPVTVSFAGSPQALNAANNLHTSQQSTK